MGRERVRVSRWVFCAFWPFRDGRPHTLPLLQIWSVGCASGEEWRLDPDCSVAETCRARDSGGPPLLSLLGLQGVHDGPLACSLPIQADRPWGQRHIGSHHRADRGGAVADGARRDEDDLPGHLCRCVPSRVSRLVMDAHEVLGGDLTMFEVERSDGSGIPTVEVLACGNGQYGGLGNALYSNAQSTPVRAKNVSGLVECEWPSVLIPELHADVLWARTRRASDVANIILRILVAAPSRPRIYMHAAGRAQIEREETGCARVTEGQARTDGFVGAQIARRRRTCKQSCPSTSLSLRRGTSCSRSTRGSGPGRVAEGGTLWLGAQTLITSWGRGSAGAWPCRRSSRRWRGAGSCWRRSGRRRCGTCGARCGRRASRSSSGRWQGGTARWCTGGCGGRVPGGRRTGRWGGRGRRSGRLSSHVYCCARMEIAGSMRAWAVAWIREV